MAKIVSTKAELEALRGLMNPDKSIAGFVLSSIDESYFNETVSKEIYNKILDAIHKDGEPPQVNHLINDPELSQDAIDFLSSGKDFKTKEEAEKSIRLLNKYRQIRGLYELAQDVSREIEENSITVDKIIEKASDQLTKVRQTKGDENAILRFGQGNNSTAMIKDVLYGEHNDDLIPTGLKIYDDVNGGFPRGGLVTLGGSTGAGKSTFAVSMGIAQASMGYRVVIVPLEMEESEMTARIIANVTNTDLSNITQNRKLEQAEKDAVYKKMGKWLKKTSQAGGGLYIYKPRGDVSLDDIFSVVNTYNPDIVYIDYISLLRGVDGDDQWLQLGKVARQAKVDASHNHRVNVLLCQVNDEGKIRYARSISEHSNVSFTFVATQETKDQGIIKINVPKCRQGRAFPFTLKVDYSHMIVKDMPQDAVDAELGNVPEPAKKNLASGL